MLHGDQMLASDWSRGKGQFLAPVGMYKDVLLWIWMYIYIMNPDVQLFWAKKAVKKIPDPPSLQHSVLGLVGG